MLFKIDSAYGHIIEDSLDGPIYQSNGTKVDPLNPRPCVGCGANIKGECHDPCIANLPGVYQACCGHGLDLSPVHGLPNGYVAFQDGRSIRFSGLVGGERIRQAVDAALAGVPLPNGFQFDENRMWWEGLTDTQRAHVNANIRRGLARLVREAKNGGAPSEAFLTGQAMWYDGLMESEKDFVQAHMRSMLADIVQEALKAVSV